MGVLILDNLLDGFCSETKAVKMLERHSQVSHKLYQNNTLVTIY